MKVTENQRQLKIEENQRTSMKINEQLWKSKKINEHEHNI